MNLFGPNIGKLAEKKDVEKLMKLLGGHKDESIRVAAAQALGKIGDVRAVGF